MADTGRPPPEPLYTFRPFHHGALFSPQAPAVNRSINHISFVYRTCLGTPASQLLQLLTTDELGWIALWSLESKRVEVLWKPHPAGINLGGCLWAEAVVEQESEAIPQAGRPTDHMETAQSHLHIISQGRDHRLVLNRIPARPALSLNRAALRPTVSDPSTEVEAVAECPANALTFCKATILACNHPTSKWGSILAAPSSVDEKFVDIFGVRTHPSTPQITRLHRAVGQNVVGDTTGSVISLSLCSPSGSSDVRLLLVGYENGAVALFSLHGSLHEIVTATWDKVGYFHGHREPVFSLCTGVCQKNPGTVTAWSVGADHKLIRYDITVVHISSQADPCSLPVGHETQFPWTYDFKPTIYSTGSPGRFDVKLRSDGRVMATIGNQGKIWMYDSQFPPPSMVASSTTNSLPPIGLLKLRTGEERESGVLAFAPITRSDHTNIRVAGVDEFDMLAPVGHRALLAASGRGGAVVVWEVFPLGD